MAESKYGKYLYTDFIKEPMPLLSDTSKGRLAFDGTADWGINYWMMWTYITKPFAMREGPHSHDYDQCCHFYGGDPSNVGEFEAEVEFYLGEEGEKQVITRPTIIYIPKGLIHCPLIYKRVDKPIIFQNIEFTNKYLKTLDTGEKTTMPSGGI